MTCTKVREAEVGRFSSRRTCTIRRKDRRCWRNRWQAASRSAGEEIAMPYSAAFRDAGVCRAANDATQTAKTRCALHHAFAGGGVVGEHGGTEDQVDCRVPARCPGRPGRRNALAEIRERFGDPVADIVAACSDTSETPKPPWRARKSAHLHHLITRSPRLLISAADKLHNAGTLVADPRRQRCHVRSLHRQGRTARSGTTAR